MTPLEVSRQKPKSASIYFRISDLHQFFAWLRALDREVNMFFYSREEKDSSEVALRTVFDHVHAKAIVIQKFFMAGFALVWILNRLLGE